MRNPFEGLRPALEIMANQGEILPATGQAVEDLMRPDQEEAYDRVRLGVDSDAILDLVIEAPNRELYVNTPEITRNQKHFFRYFLDGSARTFYLGNVVEGERQTPIHVAQIGAAAVNRDDQGRMKVAQAEHKFILLMNKDELSFGQAVEDIIRKAGQRNEFVDLKEQDQQTEGIKAGTEPRSRAAHKANWRMRVLEGNIARQLPRNPGDWLILDGGLGSEYEGLAGGKRISWGGQVFLQGT
jgi:hypothetical protein